MPEVSKRVGFRKVLTFSINGRVFGKLKNRLGMIPSTNHLCYDFSTQRWVSDTETAIISGKNQYSAFSGPPFL
ncbi:hypothetical protein E2C01_008080 [Portunus trituberculatus]|uniref:Uncharacterized protein n=1 Tax=Portunus trituberculatus TaxID=210409 RepID=A0A5B7D548_PORTR|nr:hypothetical protein [Portunus trituberculatus]